MSRPRSVGPPSDGRFEVPARCYPRRTVRLIEIRLLDGPNVYRLEPVREGRGRDRAPPDLVRASAIPRRTSLVRLGAAVPRRDWPEQVAAARATGRPASGASTARARGGVPRPSRRPTRATGSSTWPWTRRASGRGRSPRPPWRLADRGRDPARRARLDRRPASASSRRGSSGSGAPSAGPPSWIRDADRRIPIVSITGTNGKIDDDPADHPDPAAGRPPGRDDDVGRDPRRRARWSSRATGPGRAARAAILAPLRRRRRRPRDRPGRDRPPGRRLRVERREHPHERHLRPPRPPGHPHPARAGRGQGDDLPDHEAGRLGRSSTPTTRSSPRSPATVRARVAFFTLEGDASRPVRRHLAAGGRAYLVRDGELGEAEGRTWTPLAAHPRRPDHARRRSPATTSPTRSPRPPAPGRSGASLEQVRRRPRRLPPDRRGVTRPAERLPQRHAGRDRRLRPQRGRRGRAPRRRRAGSPPARRRPGRADHDHHRHGRRSSRRHAPGHRRGSPPRRAQRVAIKETLDYLRGRTRESVVGELRAGAAGRGWQGEIPVYESEAIALRAELNGAGAAATGARPDEARVVVLLCHEDRAGVFALLGELGFRPVETPAELASLAPGLEVRPRR